MVREEQTGSVISRQLAQFGFDANIDEPQPHGYRAAQPILRAASLRRCVAAGLRGRSGWSVGTGVAKAAVPHVVGMINLNQTALMRWRGAGTYAAAG